jgi:DNA-binding SARP family transcriptional activator
MWQGNYAKAQSLHTQALAIWRRLDAAAELAHTWFRLGFLCERRGNYARARVCLDRSRLFYVAAGDDNGPDMVRNRLGIVAWKEQRYMEANTLLRESLQVQRNYGHVGSCAATLLNLGALAAEQEDFRQATAYLQESLSLNRHLGDLSASAYGLVNLGVAATYRNDNPEAYRWYHEAFLTAQVLDSRGWMVDPELHFRLIDGIGTTVARYGSILAAARLWGAMDQLRTVYGLSYRALERQKYEQEVKCGRANGDGKAFSQAWEDGRCLPHEAVMALACEALAAVPSLPSLPDTASSWPLTPCVDDGNGETTVRILGLGPVEICVRERRVTTADLIYAKGQELLFYLLSHQRPTKAQIALALWPDATPEYIQRTFRVVLYHLRRALGRSDWIQREGQCYVFNRGLDYWYDAEAFAALVGAAKRRRDDSPEHAIQLLERARRLYRGDFWEGLVISDWLVRQQESLQLLHLEAMLLLGDLYLSSHQPQYALAVYHDAATREPYCEAAYRGTIRCYLALEEPAAARTQYQRLSENLWRELGVRPSVQTQALADTIR